MLFDIIFTTALAYYTSQKVSYCHYFYSCPSLFWDDIAPRGFTFSNEDELLTKEYECQEGENRCAIYNDEIRIRDIKDEILEEDVAKEFNEIGSCMWFSGEGFFQCLTVKLGRYKTIPNRNYRAFIPKNLFSSTTVLSYDDWPNDNLYADYFYPESLAIEGRKLYGKNDFASLLGIKQITDPEGVEKYFEKKIKNNWVKVVKKYVTYPRQSKKYAGDEALVFLRDGTLLQVDLIRRGWAIPYDLTEAQHDYAKDFNRLYKLNY